MDQKPAAKARTRRIGSLLGGLAILALAASPALAHTTVAPSDTVRHILLASELVGADQNEASDLEGLLDAEDGDDQGDNVDEAAGSNNDSQQVDQTGDNQDGPDEVDGSTNDDQSTDQTGDNSTDGGDNQGDGSDNSGD